jgi:ribosomal protein S18 acetylase RimI-like enzyme
MTSEQGALNDVAFRVVERFPEPAFFALSREAFADDEPSQLLTDVIASETTTRASASPDDTGALRIGCFRGDTLVAWTYARPSAERQLSMINSGVAATQRRVGIYSRLVGMVIEHASANGYASVVSRHAANNNPVIIAKLKLGFFVSGFEYSEVYGPLVRLTFLVGELRRTLHRARARPLRRIDADDT